MLETDRLMPDIEDDPEMLPECSVRL